jgi:hypothetical protein
VKRISVATAILMAMLPLRPAAAADAADTASPPAAIVCLVIGEATVQKAADADPRPVELLATIPEGAVLNTGEGARVVVGFADGRRFELSEKATARVEKGVLAHGGKGLRELEPVAALTRLAPAVKGSANQAGAGRIRADGESTATLALHPASGSRVLPGDLELRFRPLEGYRSYQLLVLEGWDDEVFSTTIESPPVKLPASVLEPGRVYHWSVTTSDPGRPKRREGAVLLTVGADDAAARAALLDQAEAAGDGSLWILLAALDRELGLEADACADLVTAAGLLSDDEAVSYLKHRYGCDAAAP